MVYLPIDPSTSVPSIERAPARPEPIQSTAPADSFNQHLERAQTKDSLETTTTTAQPSEVEEDEPAATGEEQVPTDSAESETQTESTEVFDTEETVSEEKESEEGEQPESSETLDVVEISAEVVLSDETAKTPEQENSEQIKSNQPSESHSELIDAPGDSTGNQHQTPEKQPGAQEDLVTESASASKLSDLESDVQQVIAPNVDDSQDKIGTSDEPSESKPIEAPVNVKSEQEGARDNLARDHKPTEAVLEQAEPKDTNSQNSEQEHSQPQQPQSQQPQSQTPQPKQSYVSARSESAAEKNEAEPTNTTLTQPTTASSTQASTPQDGLGAMTERELSTASPSQPQATDKIEGRGNLAPPPSGAESPGEEVAAPTRVVASRTAAASTADAPSTEPPQNVSRVRFVQRVARAFQSAGPEGGEVRLRLSPPELGALRLEVTVQRGVLSARLETETPAARILLLDNMPALRERLEQQDIKIGNFDVDLMDQPPEGMRDDPSDDAQWQREYRERGNRETDSDVEPILRDTTNSYQSGDDGALNVIV